MKGFTLVEMLVAVAIFTVVMVIAVGGLLAMSSANLRAEKLKSVVNNLNFALDSISRAAMTGVDWGCGSTPGTACATGANQIVVTNSSGSPVYFRLDTSNASICNQPAGEIGCIERSSNNVDWVPLTSPEVRITDFSSTGGYTFYVVGSSPGSTGDTVQPKLVIAISGIVQVSATQTSTFHLQTAVTQRLYDQ